MSEIFNSPHGWHPMQRVGIFVDTQNLYHSARDYYGQNVNFESFLKHAIKGRQLVRATSYVVEREGDTSAWPFIYKLSAIGFRVRRMFLSLKETTDEGKPIYEGNWDMGIAADMIRLMSSLDVVVLGSGDGDFVDIIEVLMERGIRVEVISFKETTAQRLIDAADRFIHLPDLEHAFVPSKEKLKPELP